MKTASARVACDVPNCPTPPVVLPLDFSSGFQGAPGSPPGWSVVVLNGASFGVCPLHTPAVPAPAPIQPAA